MTKTTLKTVDVNKGATDESISKTELEAIKLEAGKVADLEKSVKAGTAVQTELDTMKAALGDLDIADLVKAASELKDLKKAAEEKVITDTVDVVKGFNLFDEDKAEDVAKFFVANAGTEVNLILETLEKARTTIKEFGETEHGSDHEGHTTDLTKSEAEVATLGASVMDIIKARKGEK